MLILPGKAVAAIVLLTLLMAACISASLLFSQYEWSSYEEGYADFLVGLFSLMAVLLGAALLATLYVTVKVTAYRLIDVSEPLY
jgi:hypothetical protein